MNENEEDFDWEGEEDNEEDEDEEDESENNKLHPKVAIKYSKEIHNKILELQNILEERRHQAKVEELEDKELVAERRIELLEEEARKRQWGKEEAKRDLTRRLETYLNYVFPKRGLSKEQIEILKEKGYEQVNEYDINKQKILPFFIKPPMNHTKTHTFLVWSLKKLLERIDGVSNIREHKTKFSDLTFLYKKKYYALEVELGNLLRKKDQATQKARFLNTKFPKRWMFVVSNKNLVHEYRKLGPTAQRNIVEKKLLKMLGI